MLVACSSKESLSMFNISAAYIHTYYQQKVGLAGAIPLLYTNLRKWDLFNGKSCKVVVVVGVKLFHKTANVAI